MLNSINIPTPLKRLLSKLEIKQAIFPSTPVIKYFILSNIRRHMLLDINITYVILLGMELLKASHLAILQSVSEKKQQDSRNA